MLNPFEIGAGRSLVVEHERRKQLQRSEERVLDLRRSLTLVAGLEVVEVRTEQCFEVGGR
jgi:hypothetical protein